MSKETLVFLFGILLLIIPFLGIPAAWRQYLVVAIGVLLVMIGYGLRRAVFLKRIEQEDGNRVSDSFVETTETLFEE